MPSFRFRGSCFRWFAAFSAIAAVGLLAGCGGSSSSSTGKANKGSATNAAWYGQAKQIAAKAKKPTTTWSVPTPTVKAPSSSKRLVIVSCAQASEGCKRASAGASSAAKALGWHATIIDGKGSVSNYNAAIGQAIALHADGIVLVAVQQPDVAAQIKHARAAGIHIVSVLADAEPDPKGVEVDTTPPAYSIALGKAVGAAAILETHGKAQVAVFNAPEFTNVKDKLTGFTQELKTCSSCKVVTSVNFNDATMAQQLPDLTTSAVQSHPSVNLVWNGFDAAATFQVPALDHLGRSIKLVSFDGDSTNLNYIREGRVEVATGGIPIEWGGWAAVDELVRLFHGKSVVNERVPFKLLTKDNLPPAGALYDGEVDYQAKYKSAWAVK